MGARVIRSQAMGDSIGCELCIEPKLGEFNPKAFMHVDCALKAAHNRGLHLNLTLAGDCSYCKQGCAGEYFKDRASAGYKDFFTDPSSSPVLKSMLRRGAPQHAGGIGLPFARRALSWPQATRLR